MHRKITKAATHRPVPREVTRTRRNNSVRRATTPLDSANGVRDNHRPTTAATIHAARTTTITTRHTYDGVKQAKTEECERKTKTFEKRKVAQKFG